MKRLNFGNCTDRHAYIDENRDGVYVRFIDWPNRRAGKVDGIALDVALALAKMFVDGCPYTYDLIRGIMLEREPDPFDLGFEIKF
jgi:hypothetical protein